ncbi:MAG TPA: TOMM precursor leader peptide-binding protein [Solirubrobacterales bacterium]|jgi:bacteriocin biosynthesis cyclodehydratase domain-containing protein|nr:TOMM precursor leader peptide-binding protein [Solirubrobacterales bacterium]
MMKRPRIKRTTETVESPEGDLYLQRPSLGKDVRIERPDEKSRRLLAALDGEHTQAQLEREFGSEEVDTVLSRFAELGVIEDAADDDRVPPETMARFERQLRYFSDISTGPAASECQARLEAARIAVLGVGGLGGWSALALACCGVGEILLVDFDLVELSNLNRQVLYGEADIGRPKVLVAAERLRAFNSRMRVEPRELRLSSEADVAAAIGGYDVVIDAVDWPAHDIESWVNSACFAADIPFVAMSHFPPVARVGPFYVPGRTGCFECQLTAYRRQFPLFDVAMEQHRGRPSPSATLGPACGLIGNQVALDVMHHLTGLAPPSTLGVGHVYDLRTMEVEREAIVPEPDCPVCGAIPRISEGDTP